MTTNAKLYVTALLVLGLCVLTMNFAQWRLADPVRFSFFFFFACAASIMKVAAPAMAGKMSFNFIFVLIGLTDLTLAGNPAGRVRLRCDRMHLASELANDAAGGLFQYRQHGSRDCVRECRSFSTPFYGRLLPIEFLIVLATAAFFVANTFPMAAVVALSTQSAVLRILERKELGLRAAIRTRRQLWRCAFHALARYTRLANCATDPARRLPALSYVSLTSGTR